MREGGSPQTSGFELTARAPIDYKSIADSVANLLATRFVYEGLTVYVQKSADAASGKTYVLKSLAECGLTQGQIVQWGKTFSHWKLSGSDGVTDLSGYTQDITAETSVRIAIDPFVVGEVDSDIENKTRLGSLLNQILARIKSIALSITLIPTAPVLSVNNVQPDADGNVSFLSDSGSGIFDPVQNLAALKAINTTDEVVWKDKWLINVNELAIFYLDRASVSVADDVNVVAPTTGPGRWIRRTNIPGFTMDESGENTLSYTPADQNNTNGFFAGILTVGKTSFRQALDRMVTRINGKGDVPLYANCLFVTPSGNNVTALPSRLDRPYATIGAANAAATAGIQGTPAIPGRPLVLAVAPIPGVPMLSGNLFCTVGQVGLNMRLNITNNLAFAEIVEVSLVAVNGGDTVSQQFFAPGGQLNMPLLTNGTTPVQIFTRRPLGTYSLMGTFNISSFVTSTFTFNVSYFNAFNTLLYSSSSNTSAVQFFVPVTLPGIDAVPGVAAVPAVASIAAVSSVPGSIIFVYPGIYVEQNVIKSGVNYHFQKGAIVAPGNTLRSIDDTSGAIISTIRGQGEFRGKGYGLNDTTTIMIRNASKIDIECDFVESVECWNANANVIIRKALITFEMSAHNGGRILLDDCRVINCVNTVFSNGLIIAKNTHIENSIRQDPDYGTIAISGSPGYVNERSPVITNICMGSANTSARIVLDNCTLVSEHENVTFVGLGNTVCHKQTNMWVNPLTNGTTFNGQVIVGRSYNNRTATPQEVSFMGISYANADVSPALITNALFGTGISVEPSLNKLFLTQ